MFEAILSPFRWLMSWLLGAFHSVLEFAGLPADSGWTWALSILLLVVLIRTLLIPLFVKQIKAQRAMQAIQPELQKLQAKYKGKKDQLSRQAMAEEQMALYKKHGSNPFAACLPVIVQMPIFFALFQVLRSVPQAAANNEAIHLLTPEMVHQFNESTIFGAPLFSTLMQPGDGNHTATIVLAIVMIVAMSATQFITQKQLTARNMSDTAKASPMYRQQQMMLYLFPIIFAVGGINFPLGVLVYWTVSNLWSMGQQWWVIRNNPTKGSQAERELNERRAAKGLPPVGMTKKEHEEKVEEQRVRAAAGQRNQPVSKKRQKQQTKKNNG